MKQLIITLLLSMAAWQAPLCSAQDYYDADIYHDNEVIDSLAPVVGEWKYGGPVVEMKGKNVVSKLGKPISKGKVKSQLKKALKKLGIANKRTRLELRNDGTWGLSLAGSPQLSGRYNYSPTTGMLRLDWHGLQLPLALTKKGKRLALSADTSRLLTAVQWIAQLVNNDALATLAYFARNYSHVAIGMEFKQ